MTSAPMRWADEADRLRSLERAEDAAMVAMKMAEAKWKRASADAAEARGDGNTAAALRSTAAWLEKVYGRVDLDAA
jgi:hypothetical protein